MSDQDIFAENKEEKKEEEIQQETPAPQSDPFVDKLKAIVNENGEPKYKDVPTALEALAASQEFIKKLQAEKRSVEEQTEELARQLKEKESVESLLSKFNQTGQPQEKQETPEVHEGLGVDAIKKMVEESIMTQKQKEAAESNLSSVISSLSQKFGDQAAAEIKKKAESLGTTPADLRDMASRNPKMVLALFEATDTRGTPPTQSSTSSALRTFDKAPERPTFELGKGAARGGHTDKELVDMFRKSKDYTNKRLNIGD